MNEYRAPKKIYRDQQAHDLFREGITEVYETISSTLGPQGRLISIYHKDLYPMPTKDGVTGARLLELPDPEQNIGARYVRQAAEKTVDQAGDGTTTCTILVHSIFSEMLRQNKNAVDIAALSKAVESASEMAVKMIKERSYEISENDFELIRSIATISSNNNEEIAGYIVKALEKVGIGGLVDFQKSEDERTYVEITEGLDVDRGFYNQMFINQPRQVKCELQNPYVVLVDGEITQVNEFDRTVRHGIANNRAMLIMCDDVGIDVLNMIHANLGRPNFNICIVQNPGAGNRKREYLRDIAAATGASVIGGENATSLQSATAEHFGECKKIVATDKSTLIVEGKEKKSLVEKRLKYYEHKIKETKDEMASMFYNKQINRLKGGIAVVKVGGKTEAEHRELKFLVEDAVKACHAASEEGVSIGGGVNYLNIAQNLTDYTLENRISEVELTGYNIIIKALESVFNKLCENAGVSSEAIKEKIKSQGHPYGYDAKNNEVVNMLDAGILDATKSQRCALENAVSVCNIMLKTKTILIPIPEKE